MITLFGSGQSRSFRCLWALEEARLEYQYKPVAIGSDQENGSRTPDYLKMNSQGKVPTFLHENLVLTESASIVNYIGALATSQHLIPTDTSQRAVYDQIMFFVMADLEQPLWTNGKHRFAIPEEHRVQNIIPTTHWEFAKSLKALEKLRGDQVFICGDQFTFADIMVAQTLIWAIRFDYTVPENWQMYVKKMQERTAYQKALEAIE